MGETRAHDRAHKARLKQTYQCYTRRRPRAALATGQIKALAKEYRTSRSGTRQRQISEQKRRQRRWTHGLAVRLRHVWLIRLVSELLPDVYGSLLMLALRTLCAFVHTRRRSTETQTNIHSIKTYRELWEPACGVAMDERVPADPFRPGPGILHH